MAKIRITGHQELIEVPQEIAKRLEKQWLDTSVPRDSKLSVGRFRFTKGDVKAIFLEEEGSGAPTQHDKQVTEFFAWRDKHVKLPPEVKAKSSWDHFSLFHYGMFKQKAPLELRPKYEQIATAYYIQHPERARASPIMFYEVMGMSKVNEKPLDYNVIRILESVERNELAIIYQNTNYQDTLQQRASAEDDALQKVVQDNKELEQLFSNDEQEITARSPHRPNSGDEAQREEPYSF